MDPTRFDALARALIDLRSRREFFGAVLGGSLAAHPLGAVVGKKKASKKRKKKRKNDPPPSSRRKPPCAQNLEPGRRAAVRTLPTNQVAGCDGIKDLRLGGIWYENGKRNWALERYPQRNVGGVTIGRFVFKTRGETGWGRADAVPVGFDPTRLADPNQPGESGVCFRDGAANGPVPANRVCARVTVNFATDLEQRVFRPDWDYAEQGVSADCKTMARDYFTMVDEHEALHLQDNEAIQAWYASEWGQRTCYACVARNGQDDGSALAAATEALNGDLDRVIAAVSAEIERDSAQCGNKRDDLSAQDPDCSRCGCGDGLRRASVACGQACCGVCQECADPETSSCVPKVCDECEVCRDGECVPIDCGGPCFECTDNACRPKSCGECEVCDGGDCVPVDCGDPCLECAEDTCRPKRCGECEVCQDGACVPKPAEAGACTSSNASCYTTPGRCGVNNGCYCRQAAAGSGKCGNVCVGYLYACRHSCDECLSNYECIDMGCCKVNGVGVACVQRCANP